MFKHKGATRTVAEWAMFLGIKPGTFAKRLRAFEAGLIKRAVLMTAGHLPTTPPANRESRVSKAQLRAALRANGGNITAASAALGVSRQTGSTLVKRYRLRKEG